MEFFAAKSGEVLSGPLHTTTWLTSTRNFASKITAASSGMTIPTANITATFRGTSSGPGSIDELAIRQRRNKDEIEQDVLMLAKADIVTFEDGIVQSVAKTIVFEQIPQLASEA